MATTTELNHVIKTLDTDRLRERAWSGQEDFHTAIAIVVELRDNGNLDAAGHKNVLDLLVEEKGNEYSNTQTRRDYTKAITIWQAVEVPVAE